MEIIINKNQKCDDCQYIRKKELKFMHYCKNITCNSCRIEHSNKCKDCIEHKNAVWKKKQFV